MIESLRTRRGRARGGIAANASMLSRGERGSGGVATAIRMLEAVMKGCFGINQGDMLLLYKSRQGDMCLRTPPLDPEIDQGELMDRSSN